MSTDNRHVAYWRASITVVLCCLAVWFTASFGCGILLREWLDEHMPPVGTAPFGFWMAQQGAILCFVAILIAYAVLMNRLDRIHGYSEDDHQ